MPISEIKTPKKRQPSPSIPPSNSSPPPEKHAIDPQDAAERLANLPTLMIALDQIHLGANHRINLDEAKVVAMVASIKANGMQSAVRVYELDAATSGSMGKLYELGYGFTRFEAARRLGYPTIESKVHPPAPQAEIEQARLIENVDHADLSPAERAAGVRALLRTIAPVQHSGMSPIATAAAMLGKPESWVRDLAYLSHCTDRVMKLLHEGRLLLGHARELAKVGDPKEQGRLADMAARHGDVTSSMWPVKRLAAEIEAARRGLKGAGWRLDVAFAGKIACSVCEHNTASEPLLFETGKVDVGLGCCVNESCWQHKVKKTEEAKEKTVAKMAKSHQEPTAANVRAAAPEFVRESTMQGFAKRKLTPKTAPADKAKGGLGVDPEIDDIYGCMAWNGAIVKYDAELNEWKTDLVDEIIMKLAGDASLLMQVAALGYTVLWGGTHLNAIEFDYSYPYNRHRHKHLGFDPLGAQTVAAITAVGGPFVLFLEKLHGVELDLECAGLADHLQEACPEALTRLAKAMGVAQQHITDPPTWDQFNPELPNADPALAAVTEEKPVKKPRKGKAKGSEVDHGS